MIGHKKYETASGVPLLLSRKCGRLNGMPLKLALSNDVPPESMLEWCRASGVESVSLFSDAADGSRYGDYVVRVEHDSFESAVHILYAYWTLLIKRYAVDRRQIEFFKCEDSLFLQVDARAFSNERGYKGLHSVYIAMNKEIKRFLSEGGLKVKVVAMINPFLHYVPCFSEEWHAKEQLIKQLDPSVDAPHLLHDSWNDIPINWVEYYTRHRPKVPAKMSLMRDVFLRAKHAVGHSVWASPYQLGNLKQCALLQDVASTTVWEDEDELYLLGGVCGALNVRSFRRLCVCAGVVNPKMREADYASSWLTHDMPSKHCEDLAQRFQYTCPTNCGVTTPLALPYMPAEAVGPASLFFNDGKYVYLAVDGRPEAGERICTYYQAMQTLRDEYGEYWGYTLSPDQGRSYYSLKIAGESKKAILFSLEKIGIKVFKKDLAYQFALSVEELGIADLKGPVLSQGSTHAGWSQFGNILTYSFPYKQFFEMPTAPFLYGDSYKCRHVFSGNLEQWGQALKVQPIPDVLLLGLAVSLAGPLLRPINCSSFVVHLWGGTSVQRKHVLKVASSVWGGRSFVQSYSAVSEHIGEIAAAHNDGLIAINFNDSISQTKVRNLLRRLLNGDTLDTSYGSRLRHAILSTGQAPVKTGKGDECIINIELPNVLGEQVGKLLDFEQHYGHAGPHFIRYLLNVSCDELVAQQERTSTYLSKKGRATTDIASRLFSAMSVALIRTSESLNFPLAITTVSDAFERLFIDWTMNRTENEKEAVRRVVDFIQKESVSARMGDAVRCQKGIDYDGYIFADERVKGVFFPTAQFKALFCDTVSSKRLAELLYSDGLLVRGADGRFDASRWVPGLKRARRGYFVRQPRLI
ncbi:DUF927 domain-containing protein [Pseudodesulfovibrio sp. zrk46]|uniref:DUF927 domain-containing protein n=1 Tax=Pseudodesulfovibrio sp. zrk46 TaxID=2725288 RepID=UPI001448B0AD|nr:DUF927 domain-containing protein [Pseudodesulfovibrio sp. zrk46]QJB57385.1 DUF927 domain-containing protein [Pseudodesulfovibrio sp. zrk46]